MSRFSDPVHNKRKSKITGALAGGGALGCFGGALIYVIGSFIIIIGGTIWLLWAAFGGFEFQGKEYNVDLFPPQVRIIEVDEPKAD